jgi:hypothetical protein
MITRARTAAATLSCIAALGGLLLWLVPRSAGAGPVAPVNDNFLFSNNLNSPRTTLHSSATLSDVTYTIGATVQSNLFSPCRMSSCRTGPQELTSCQGVSYGKSVWYDFYPQHDGQIEIRTTGIPNVITLYRYDPHSLVPHVIQCASGSTYRSNELAANVRAGVDYTYQIGGRNSDGGILRMRFNYAYGNHLTVNRFLTAPIFSTVTGLPGTTRLIALNLIGLVRNESLSFACAACGGATFGTPLVRGNTATVKTSAPILITRQTRVVVGASSPAQIGRFKIYAVDALKFALSLRVAGCLTPGAASVSTAPIGVRSSLSTISCPARLVNAIDAEYVFWTGAHQRLWERWYSGAHWTKPSALGATSLQSPPAVAVHANGGQDVFWKGPHGHLWEAWFLGRWRGPADLGETLGSGPTVGVDSAGNEYVFWQGVGGHLFEKVFTGGAWSPAIPLNAGTLGSGPAVAIHPDGEQDVFWKGLDGHLWETWYTDRWNGPVDLGGGQLGSPPSVAVDGTDHEYVFWQGTNGWLWTKTYANRTWSQPVQLRSGKLGSAPTVAVQANGQQDVFWRGLHGDLWETWYTNKWNGPIDLGGDQVVSPPAAGADAAGKQTAPREAPASTTVAARSQGRP